MGGGRWLRISRRRINLALQGGGAHGAFTWGVLDRLLEDETLDLGWISATSAGAINAVAMVAGLAKGGRAEARSRLRAIWGAIYKAGVPDLIRLNPFLYGLSRSFAVSHVASLWSPYDLNPLGFDPLRQVVAGMVDFEAVRSWGQGELLVAATEVATGRARLFRRKEMTADAVLASACLPILHHAVEIDGVAYWDGGFSANPDIVTLACESPVGDTLIVHVNPLVAPVLPTGARAIAAHANTLTFNAPLRRDIDIVLAARDLAGGWRSRNGSRLAPLARHRFHMVEAGRYTGALSPESKMKPDWALFVHLHDAGRAEASAWLDLSRASIGVRATVDLAKRFRDAPTETMVPLIDGARSLTTVGAPGAKSAKKTASRF